MEKEIERDLLTRQLLAKASPMPVVKADFTAQVLVRMEAETSALKAKIYEPLIPGRIWRWIGISVCSMLLVALSLGVLAFGAWPNLQIAEVFQASLNKSFFYNQPDYLLKLLVIGLICFCWLVLDYLYTQVKKQADIR